MHGLSMARSDLRNENDHFALCNNKYVSNKLSPCKKTENAKSRDPVLGMRQ